MQYATDILNENITWCHAGIAPTPDFTDIDYGLLYNWYAVNNAAGLVPIGWHIPTEDEWFTLFNSISTQATCGLELMEIGTVHWDSVGGTNTSGYTAIGNGYRKSTDGTFDKLNITSPTWTSKSNLTSAYAFYCSTGSDAVLESLLNKKYGCAVRPIKNDSINPGSVTDMDGNTYPTAKIGNQVWMTSNLVVKHYNDGTLIPEVTDNATWAALATGAWCYYNNDPAKM